MSTSAKASKTKAEQLLSSKGKKMPMDTQAKKTARQASSKGKKSKIIYYKPLIYHF